MMNEFERAELDAENDGYTNDFQRAFAASHMRRKPTVNGRAAAEAMVAQGLFVGVEFSPEYGSITDAILGTRFTLVAHGLTREEVAAKLEPLQDELSDSRFEIWPHAPVEYCPATRDELDSEVPF